MAETSPKAQSSKGKYVAVGIGIGVVVVVLAIIATTAGSGPGGTSLIPSERRTTIVDQTFGVGARDYEDYQFSIPEGASNARVIGHFTTQGGSGNDITVMIMDDTEFTNYNNGKAPWTYYLSEMRTAGDINVAIPSGTSFHLVFDNTFSIVSNKNIDADIELVYTG